MAQYRTKLSPIFHSSKWMTAASIVTKGITFVQFLVLARWLTPNDFGTIGIILFSAGMILTFTETGSTASLIQQKELTKESIDTCWTIGVIRGILLCIIIYISAPVIGLFFADKDIASLMRLYSLTPVLIGIQNIGIHMLQRELCFSNYAFYQMLTSSATFLCTIVCVFFYRDIRAFIIGQVIGTAASVAFSFYWHPYRPHLSMDMRTIKHIFVYGRNLSLSAIFLFFLTQGDNAIVGKLLGNEALGYYILAYSLANLPATTVSSAIGNVMFPVYSNIRDNIAERKDIFLKVLLIVSLISIGIGAAIFFFADTIIISFYGIRWQEAVMPLRILCLYGVLRSIGGTIGPMLMGFGMPGLLTRLILVHLVIFSILIYPLTKLYGIQGTSAAVVISYLPVFFLAIYTCNLALKGKSSFKILGKEIYSMR